MTIRFKQTRERTPIEQSDRTAAVLLVEFDNHDEYTTVNTNGHANASYLTQLCKALVGLTMPIHVQITVPLKPEDILPETRAMLEANDLIVKEGSTPTLKVHALLTHPEVDDHELTPELLPMLMSEGVPKRVARLVAREAELRSDRPPESTLELP